MADEWVQTADTLPMMSGTDCRAWWINHFADSPPVGFLLRQIYSERWFRIHSLPESKRYAETEEEYAEIFLRHNALATEALGQGSRCYRIQGFWVEPEKGEKGWVIALESEELKLCFEGIEMIWNHSQYDTLIREIADGKTANVVFVSRESGRIYAPYDGGADLICCNEQECDEWKRAYRAWLSAHPEGL